MFQQLILVGNLGRDPEMRYTPSGQAVTNMNLAVNRTYTNSQDEQVEEVTWFRVTAWGKQAESCNQYLKKGRQILVVGRVIADESGNPKTFERNDGSIGSSFEVNAQVVRFLGSRPIDAEAIDELVGAATETEDDIPF